MAVHLLVLHEHAEIPRTAWDLAHAVFSPAMLRCPCMSEATPPSKSRPAGVSTCTQCEQTIPHLHALRSRHAIPCGQVVCGPCVDALSAKQEAGTVKCRSCDENLAPAREFPVAWCTRRPERLAQALAERLRDQGDAYGSGEAGASDSSSNDAKTAEADASWGVCAVHGKAIVAGEAETLRPLCDVCIFASAKPLAAAIEELRSYFETGHAEVARARATVLDVTISDVDVAIAAEGKQDSLDGDGNKCLALDSDRVLAWAERETARVRAWESIETSRVRSVAEQSVGLIAEVSARRITTCARLRAQRAVLRASLDELEAEIASELAGEGRPATAAAAAAGSSSSPNAERAGKLLLMGSERRRLVAMLNNGTIDVPNAAAVRRWARLPALIGEFGVEGKGTGETAATGDVAGLASRALEWYRELSVGDACTGLGLGQSLPSAPRLVSRACCGSNRAQLPRSDLSH